ncbi:MAG TPA: aquaporin [Gemmatimonadales bacterium]
MRRYLTEFIGTFFFILVISLVVTPGGQAWAPLAIGATLMVVVYMGGHVSGGHYNPAVSLAVYLRGKLEARDVLPYMVAQILGATAAAYISFLLLGQTFAPAPGASATTTGALMVELLFTFLLALVVLNSATSKHTQGNSYYGLAIGFTIVVAAFAGGGISGGAFNPAVATGPTLVNALFGGGTMGNLWIYLVGPFLGGALASMVFRVQEDDAG